jgi:hypothetical protein
MAGEADADIRERRAVEREAIARIENHILRGGR